MASDLLSSVPASAGDVWRRSLLFIHPAASVADRDDAWRLDALAEHHGHERGHRGSDRRNDLAGRRWAIPACAPAHHGSGGVDRCLAVLCAAPVRGYLLVPRRGLEFSRSCAAWQFPLSLARYFALVHGEHRRPPHPSSMQSNSLLSVAGCAAGPSAARGRQTNHPAAKLAVRAHGFVGRERAAAHLVWRGGSRPSVNKGEQPADLESRRIVSAKCPRRHAGSTASGSSSTHHALFQPNWLSLSRRMMFGARIGEALDLGELVREPSPAFHRPI